MADPVKAPTAAPAAAPSPEAKPVKERGPGYATFPTAEAATKEAQDRKSGHRRAFKTTFGGKDTFMVAHNPHNAGYLAFTAAGGKVEEIGKTARVKAPTIDGVIAALNALGDEERKIVMEKLKGLKK